jgi:hypothetical protein
MEKKVSWNLVASHVKKWQNKLIFFLTFDEKTVLLPSKRPAPLTTVTRATVLEIYDNSEAIIYYYH